MQPASGDLNGEPERSEFETISSPTKPDQDPAAIWQQVIESIAHKNPSLAANLAKCQIIKTTGPSLEIEVPGNGFTLNMIQREKNMVVLKQVCADISGRREIRFTSGNTMEDKHRKKKKDNQLKQKALSHPLVADAIEIFGGKLLDVKIL